MKVIFPAVISRLTTMAGDKSLRLQVDSQSLEPSDKAILFGFHEKYVYVCIAENEVESEIDKVPDIPTDKEEKTPSQRLRGVLYRLWENDPTQNISFEIFYRSEMEKILSHYKNKI